MPLEYEYRYKKFDRKKILNKLNELGAIYYGTWLFRIQVFYHPIDKSYTYIRVRDEGHRITMTFKKNSSNKIFPIEHEVIIDNFDEGCAILIGLGCEKKYHYEKIREIWHIQNTEVCWDTNPGRYDIMEVESKSKRELEKYVNLLELSNIKHDDFTDDELYLNAFGIIMPKNVNLTFNTVKEILGKYCTKNKNNFNKLISKQKKISLIVLKSSKQSVKKSSKQSVKKSSKQPVKKSSK